MGSSSGRTPSGHCLGCGTVALSIHYPGCWIKEPVLTKNSPSRTSEPTVTLDPSSYETKES